MSVVLKENTSDKVQKAIKDHLDKRGKLRATELKKAICDEQGICSEKVFYKYLDQLVKLKSIMRNEQDRANVSYYKPDWAEYENHVANSVVKLASGAVTLLDQVGREPIGTQAASGSNF